MPKHPVTFYIDTTPREILVYADDRPVYLTPGSYESRALRSALEAIARLEREERVARKKLERTEA